MHDGIAVYAIDLRQDAPFELLFVGDANVAQHRAGELGEEAFDEIEPGAMFGQEGECEASLRLLSQPGPGFLGLVGGVIVETGTCPLGRGVSALGCEFLGVFSRARNRYLCGAGTYGRPRPASRVEARRDDSGSRPWRRRRVRSDRGYRQSWFALSDLVHSRSTRGPIARAFAGGRRLRSE